MMNTHPLPCRAGYRCKGIIDETHRGNYTHPKYTYYKNESQLEQFIKGLYYAYLFMNDITTLPLYEAKIREYCDNHEEFINTLQTTPQNIKTMFTSQFPDNNVELLHLRLDHPTQYKTTFIYNLFVYVACNMCTLVKNDGDRDFLSLMLAQFNEEAIDRAFKIDKSDKKLKRCIENIHRGIDPNGDLPSFLNAMDMSSVLATTNVCKDNPGYGVTLNPFYN